MLSIDQIREQVVAYGQQINAPRSLLKVFPSPQPDAHPYIQVYNDRYFYRVDERGCEIECRETKDIDVLLYWIMHDIIFKMASDYERLNRVEGDDCRRILFKKEIELFTKLNAQWGHWVELEIQEVLLRVPYSSGNQDNQFLLRWRQFIARLQRRVK